MKEINEIKSGVFEIIKSKASSQTKKKGEKTQITHVRNERGNTITDRMGIKRVINRMNNSVPPNLVT